MVVGTASDAGKSLTVGALCRILRQDGVDVAPFKAQNMALNSFATREGHEIGRAQAMQAEAARVEPHVDMNPILLKPTSDVGSQVVINGKVLGNYSGVDYYGLKPQLLEAVSSAYQRLAARHEVVVLEGAGSPVEMNLKDRDVVNMQMAEIADAACIRTQGWPGQAGGPSAIFAQRVEANDPRTVTDVDVAGVAHADESTRRLKSLYAGKLALRDGRLQRQEAQRNIRRLLPQPAPATLAEVAFRIVQDSEMLHCDGEKWRLTLPRR